MTRAFISYCREDVEHAVALQALLDAAGLQTWRDQENVYAGDRWPKTLGDAVADADVLVLLWSNASAVSDFVELEWCTAFAMKKPVIPVFLDDTPLPASLSAVHAMPMADTADLPQAIGARIESSPKVGPEFAARAQKILAGAEGKSTKAIVKELQSSSVRPGHVTLGILAVAVVVLVIAVLYQPVPTNPCDSMPERLADAGNVRAGLQTAGLADYVAGLDKHIDQQLRRCEQVTEAQLRDDGFKAKLATSIANTSAVIEMAEEIVVQTRQPSQAPGTSFGYQVMQFDPQAKQLNPISPGHRMRSGDLFLVDVTLPQLSYLYVLLRSENGKLRRVYPLGEQIGRAVEGKVRIPGGDQALELDDQTGREELFFWVEQQRKPLIESAVAEVGEEFETNPEVEELLMAAEGFRGAELKSGLQIPDEPTVETRLTGAVATFAFDHVP